MKETIKKEVLYDLTKAIEILEVKEAKDIEGLKELSDHSIDNVALYKDLDIISITVLLYSLYKVVAEIPEQDYKDILAELKFAKGHLEKNSMGRYNRSIKALFELVSKSNTKVKEHLDDVMQAARIKKGAILLKKGLSLGQAAGLMGLSNWDLQHYVAKTMAFEQHHEKVTAKVRLQNALKIFGLN